MRLSLNGEQTEALDQLIDIAETYKIEVMGFDGEDFDGEMVTVCFPSQKYLEINYKDLIPFFKWLFKFENCHVIRDDYSNEEDLVHIWQKYQEIPRILILDANHPEILSFRLALLQDASTALVGSILFSQWRYIERVAIVKVDQHVIGMATLARCGENGRCGPQIAGIWVHPDYRRQKIGRGLVEALAEKSLDLLGKKVSMIPVTLAGQGLAVACQPLVEVLPSLTWFDL